MTAPGTVSSTCSCGMSIKIEVNMCETKQTECATSCAEKGLTVLVNTCTKNADGQMVERCDCYKVDGDALPAPTPQPTVPLLPGGDTGIAPATPVPTLPPLLNGGNAGIGMPGNADCDCPRGPQGITGPAGPQGIQGPPCVDGTPGTRGAPGTPGTNGAQGPPGSQGEKGET